MLAVSLIAVSAVVGGAMPWRRRIVRWLYGLIEWEDSTPDRRRRFTVGHPAAIGTLGAMMVALSLSLWGGLTTSPLLGGGGMVDAVPAAESDFSDLVVFATEWSTGEGTGTAAIFDSARDRPWTTNKFGANQLEVVDTASTGCNFPATVDNVLRHTLGNGRQIGTSGWGAPTVGQAMSARWYFCFTSNDSITIHPNYFDSAFNTVSNSPLSLNLGGPGELGGTSYDSLWIALRTFLSSDNGYNSWESFHATGNPCNNFLDLYLRQKVFRAEVMAVFQSDSTWRVSSYIYDESDNVVIGPGPGGTLGNADSTFRACNGGHRGDSLSNHIFENVNGQNARHLKWFTHLNWGIEGSDDPSPDSESDMEWCCVLVLKGDSADVIDAWPIGVHDAEIDEEAWSP